MDQASFYGTELLSAMADSRRLLSAMEQRLRALPEVRSVKSRYEPEMLYLHQETESRIRVRSELDAELSNGSAVTWWFSLFWDDKQWITEAEIGSNDSLGYQTLQEFAPRTADTLDGCIQILAETTNDMINHENIWLRAC